MDIREEDTFSKSYKIDDENYQYSSLGQLNEKAEILSNVEGDDEDILGETENARRNEQKNKSDRTNQGTS